MANQIKTDKDQSAMTLSSLAAIQSTKKAVQTTSLAVQTSNEALQTSRVAMQASIGRTLESPYSIRSSLSETLLSETLLSEKALSTGRKCKVIQIVQHLRPGGLETLALELHRSLSNRCDMQILALEGNQEEALNHWPRLQEFESSLHFLDKPPGLSPVALTKLVKFVKKQQPDVIHTHHIGPLLYGGIAAKLCGVKVVHTEHDAWHLKQPKRAKLQNRLCKAISPVLIADAQMVANSCKQYLQSSDYQVIPNGINTQHFVPGSKSMARNELGLPHRVQFIGCAARLEAEKGHRVLLDALKAVPQNVHLALAGQGNLEQSLREQCAELEISDRVHFLGNLENMPLFYQALDLFCLSSFNEGLPLAPLEAQSCGIPCVLTEVGGAFEALCPDTGYLVPAGDPDALAQMIIQRLETPLVISPRKFACELRDIQNMSSAYEVCYQNQ